MRALDGDCCHREGLARGVAQSTLPLGLRGGAGRGACPWGLGASVSSQVGTVCVF